MKPLDFTLDQMRELLDATAEYAAEPTAARRRELLELLSGYQRLVAERIVRLRERLQGAKALQDALDDLLL
jgi:hypothetical protein